MYATADGGDFRESNLVYSSNNLLLGHRTNTIMTNMIEQIKSFVARLYLLWAKKVLLLIIFGFAE
jgi:hypothetical protein